ncbi:hypothetical protein SAMN04488121_103664 [Chitinophaga filiformis]|uniref:Uncharacterized protein n=1 Tax=Chitinophaga filiformis TaxID=104663 RepID=A0A1G7RYD8_CHIFI|nr:hypothetical protein SAMN04488121_103664 [Chitinophaga filiformis]
MNRLESKRFPISQKCCIMEILSNSFWPEAGTYCSNSHDYGPESSSKGRNYYLPDILLSKKHINCRWAWEMCLEYVLAKNKLLKDSHYGIMM